MAFCVECGKKANRNRIIDPVSNLCADCSSKVALNSTHAISTITIDNVVIDESRSIGDLNIGEFKSWLESTLSNQIRNIVKDEVSSQIHVIKQKVDLLNKDNERTKISLATAEGRILNLQDELKKVNEENDNRKKVSNNNLKYLY